MQKFRNHILSILLLGVLLILVYIGPQAQDPAYHKFADHRMFFGVPNFWDVISNLPMLLIGIYGLYQVLARLASRDGMTHKLLPIVLVLGILSSSFGSAYYHYAPDNHTLVWDRLPMTLMFMPFFALIIYDYIGPQAGVISFWVLVPLGIFSIYYWDYTESLGRGDLRLYAFVQFFPMLAIPVIMVLYESVYAYASFVIYILLIYLAAKVSEHFDQAIFDALHFWSGHTIKHLLAAIALIFVLKILKARENHCGPES